MVLGSRWQTNCYLLTSATADGREETLIIDPGDEPERLISYVKRRNITVVGAVATHAHNDHIGAMLELRSQLGIPIMIHADDLEMASDPELSGFFEEPGNENYVVDLWDRVLNEGDVISWGSDVMRVLHTPGHTRGAICLCDCINRRLFTGDTLFAGAIGRTDFAQGDDDAMCRTCRRLVSLNAVHPGLEVYPGHGHPTFLAVEVERNAMFRKMAGLN
ncbi:MAG: MBL fold metallo-hydrolase [Bifidobacteriaceae bacterium]|nr:MBL fold metallo-hydrolase [Bifidobacteriaceae bacterium]